MGWRFAIVRRRRRSQQPGEYSPLGWLACDFVLQYTASDDGDDEDAVGDDGPTEASSQTAQRPPSMPRHTLAWVESEEVSGWLAVLACLPAYHGEPPSVMRSWDGGNYTEQDGRSQQASHM